MSHEKSTELHETLYTTSHLELNYSHVNKYEILLKFKMADSSHIANRCLSIMQQLIVRFQWNFAWESSLSRKFQQWDRWPTFDRQNVFLVFPVRFEKKECIVLREIHLRTTGRHLSNGITQCYLLPDRGGRPAFTPTGQVGTRFIDPVRMKGWVGLLGWLHTEMVYPSTDGHPSEY